MRRQILQAIIHSNIPLLVKIESLLFLLFFPNFFTGLVAMRETILLHQGALEKHNAAIRLLDERVAVFWKESVERKAYIG